MALEDDMQPVDVCTELIGQDVFIEDSVFPGADAEEWMDGREAFFAALPRRASGEQRAPPPVLRCTPWPVCSPGSLC